MLRLCQSQAPRERESGAGTSARYPQEPPAQALGRSRGGFGSKFHLVTDDSGLLLAIEVSSGQGQDWPSGASKQAQFTG